MAGLLKREAKSVDAFDRFDRMFDEWAKSLPFRRPQRTLPLPAGVSESDVSASYKDGILEIRIPAPEPKPAKKIAISKT